MSYILEALKKADQQRELGKVPGIDTGHDTGKRARGRYWLWLIVVVLLMNALVLTVLFWPAETVDIGSDPLIAAAPEVEAYAPVRPIEPPPPRPAQRILKPIPAPASVVQPEIDPDAARLALARSLLPATEDGLPVVPQPPPEPVTQTPPAASRNLPVWPQIPQSLFGQLSGGLHLDVHVYANVPQNRFVLINMRKYYEGERLQEGPVLDEITPEGVILSLRGQRFRVQAQ